MSAYAMLSSGPMTYRACIGTMAATSGLKPVRSVLNCSNNSRRHSEVHPMPNASIPDGATPHLGEGSRMPDGRTKLPAALAIAVRVLLR